MDFCNYLEVMAAICDRRKQNKCKKTKTKKTLAHGQDGPQINSYLLVIFVMQNNLVVI